jgi:phosphatidylserine decarboxylase
MKIKKLYFFTFGTPVLCAILLSAWRVGYNEISTQNQESGPMEIKFYSRTDKKIIKEDVYGERWVKWFYSLPERKLLHHWLTAQWFSKLCGFWHNLSLSRRQISSFIKNYSINIHQFLPQNGRSEESPYANFNQFFIRRFKPGVRRFVESPEQLPAFAEARYLGYALTNDQISYPVKGDFLKARDLLSNTQWEKYFEGGPMLIARLCPVDYHRFHFPDDGEILVHYTIPGKLHSVSPMAVSKVPDILITNERQVTIIDSQNFGKLAVIEIGAMGVGKIVQTYMGVWARRGEEKGYFLFGASTVILLGEKGRWQPSADITYHSKQGTETLVLLGDVVAQQTVSMAKNVLK